MSAALDRLSWPAERVAEALALLARRGALDPRPVEPGAPPPGVDLSDPTAREIWIQATAAEQGVEIDDILPAYAEVDALFPPEDPLLIEIPAGDGAPRFLAALPGRSAKRVSLLASDHGSRAVPAEEIRAALRRRLDRGFEGYVERVLDRARIDGRGRGSAARAILRAQLGRETIGGVYALRLPPGASPVRQARRERLFGKVGVIAAAHAAQYLLTIASWWLLGSGALEGRLDSGWMLGWVLLLAGLVPFRVATGWAQGRFAIGAGKILKRRLLHGALRLEPEETRSQGTGRMLGRVIESQAVESLALGGGLLGLVALVEIAIASGAVASGAGGGLVLLLMAAWLAVIALGAAVFGRRQRAWTRDRIDMTHDLVERMVGHRTRVAQERRERWHDGEDAALERYARVSAAMDRSAVTLSLLPRAWLAVGLLGLVPAFVGGDVAPERVAVAVGGLLLVAGAFARFVSSFSQLAGAGIAWKEIAPLFRAAARPAIPGVPSAVAAGVRRRERVLEASDIVFRYRPAGEPVLDRCGLRLDEGDRALLVGPSGSGKSTLASILAGIRSPESGLVLLSGLDRPTLGPDGWRRRVAAAPQFHENHVLTGPLSLNLLIGRRWPASPKDLAEAEEICRELSLGDLLDRMPGGLAQIVGETGWQLSHGEKSRVFVARALLQGADVVLLDESFAALDPETLRTCLDCAVRRARTLLVIAHP